MSAKRGSSAIGEPALKRSKTNRNGGRNDRQNVNSALDPDYGQRYAFGDGMSTTIPDGLGLEFEDDAEALVYLRSVRHEAATLPKFSTSKEGLSYEALNPRRSSSKADSGSQSNRRDFGGYFDDGAYIATSDPSETSVGQSRGQESSVSTGRAHELQLYETYCRSVLARFHSLRRLLYKEPPASAVRSLPPTHNFCVRSSGQGSSLSNEWSTRMRSTDPLPAQVASIDKHDTLRLLHILMTGKFLRRGCELRERTSRWLWALLARLPEPGELNHFEIARIRDLGHRAALMNRSLADMVALREEIEADTDDYGAYAECVSSAEASQESCDHHVQGGPQPLYHEDSTCGPPLTSDGQTWVGVDHHGPTKLSAGDMELSDGEVDESVAPVCAAPTQFTSSHQTLNIANRESNDHDHGTEVEEGEVVGQSGDIDDPIKDIEAARNRLLQQLDAPGSDDDGDDWDSRLSHSSSISEESLEHDRSRINMRATLNMILTVAGEVYGQRDLLEFRETFPAI